MQKIFFLCLFFVYKFTFALSPEFYADPKKWHDLSIVEHLETASIKSMIPMGEYLESIGKTYEFVNHVFLVEFESGVRAVFKQSDDMPSHFEKIAYDISCQLTFPYVPPTTMRTINGQEGSLQLFVDTTVDVLQGNEYEKLLAACDQEDLENFKIFCFVFGSWDAGPHNLLSYTFEEKTYLIAIDNECIGNMQKARYGERPYVRLWYDELFNTNDFDKPFPFDSYKIIERNALNSADKKLVSKLPSWFLSGTEWERRKYTLYRNGFWVQFYGLDTRLEKSYTKTCSMKTYEALKSINKQILFDLYKDVLKQDLFKVSQIDDILDRRDQVLAVVIPEE